MLGVGQAHVEAHHEAHEQLTDTEASVLAFVEGKPKSGREIAGRLGLQSRSGHLYKAIDHLRNLGFFDFIIPDKAAKQKPEGLHHPGRSEMAY
jgi:hypothetical protein